MGKARAKDQRPLPRRARKAARLRRIGGVRCAKRTSHPRERADRMSAFLILLPLDLEGLPVTASCLSLWELPAICPGDLPLFCQRIGD